MRTIRKLASVIAAASATLLCATAPLTAQDGSEEPLAIEVTRLGEDIYLMRAPSALDTWTSSSSLVVVGSQHVLVFDNNALPSTTRLVLDRIRRITDLPVGVLINSHWHMDHWSGNEVYEEAYPGLQIISSFRTRDIMAHMPNRYFRRSAGVERARARLERAQDTGILEDGTASTEAALAELRQDLRDRTAFAEEVASVRRVLPNLVYSDSLTFTLDERTVQLYSVTGDAAGSTIMYLPDEGLLATGDVLVRQEDGHGAQPWTMNSFAVSEWLEGLRKLESFDAAIIVPGQGPALHDNEYLRTTRELYEVLIEQSRRALRGGAVTLEEIRDEVDVERFRDRYALDTPERNASFDAVVAALITRIAQEAHDGVRPPS